MKDLKKATAAILISSILSISPCNAHDFENWEGQEYDCTAVQAENCDQSMCGQAYEDCHYRLAYLAPAIALGVIITVALVVVIVNNSSGSHDNFHTAFGS